MQFGTISKFGLMEMSRQRLKPALSEGAHINCPRCGGSGHIRDAESSALQILRIIQEESMKDNTAAVNCQVPVEVASFLLNEKRTEIQKIELKQRVSVTMVPNKALETPHYKLDRMKHDDPRLDSMEASYKLADPEEEQVGFTRRSQEPTNKQTPVIKGVLPDAPAPIAEPRPAPAARTNASKPAGAVPAAPAPAPETGLWAAIKRFFGFATPTPVTAQAPAAPEPAKDARKENREGRSGNRRSGERGERNGSANRDGNRRNSERTEGERGGRNRNERSEGRGEARTGEQEGRDNRRRNERGDRPERSERNDRPRRDDAAFNAQNDDNAAPEATGERQERAPRPERAPRENRRDRGDRGERNERRSQGEELVRDNAGVAPAPMDSEAVIAALPSLDLEGNANAIAPADGEASPERRERRSRDRYGRDRRNRGDRERLPRDEQSADAQPDAAPAEAISEAENAPAPRRSYFDAAEATSTASITPPAADFAEPLVKPAVSAVVEATDEKAVPAPVVQAPAAIEQIAPVVAATTAPTPAAEPATQQGLPRIASYTLPLDQLNTIAAAAGLQWVNSDANKVAVVQAAIAAEPKPVHVPRERRPVVMLDEGPLVLVETRKDLAAMVLPFERESQTA